MWPESSETPAKLKSGLTTGACATACGVAAAQYLLAGITTDTVSIRLPKGRDVEMPITRLGREQDAAFAATIKDAGDDPDVTHGAEICVSVKKTLIKQVQFIAGEGVGTVTRDGLLLAVGEPAINPVPRQMIQVHLESIREKYHYEGGFAVTVSVAGGEALAKKTMNPRLGIIGGLSILGTTGIVRPFSCAAYIASIHQGVDVARANGISHIAATTGNTSETYAKTRFQLSDMALIEMGDFVGALLKHVRKHPVAEVTLCGGFGKISKLANGHMDLHAKVSSINFEFLAELAVSLGASPLLIEKIKTANTSIEALGFCAAEGIDLAAKICEKAHAFARSVIKNDRPLRVIAISRKGERVGEYATGFQS